MNLDALDFIVVNVSTGNAIAAFMLPGDALALIRHRRRYPVGPGFNPRFEIHNLDGSPITPQLELEVEKAHQGLSS